MGSTKEARRAGTKQARAAATRSNSVTPARMSGSRELSITHFVTSLSKAMQSRRPTASPPPTFTAVEDMTIRNTSADFAPRAMRMPNSFLQVANAHHLLFRVHLNELGANVVQNRHRREVGAHQNLGEHPQPQSVRHIDGRFDGVSQAVVTGIRDDADDLQPAFASRSSRRVRRLTFEIGNTDLLPDGVAVWPILPRHSLVYHRERGAAHGFGLIPDSALRQGNVEDRKVFWTYEVEARLRLLPVVPHDFDSGIAAIRWRRGVGRNAGGDNLRDRRDLRAELLEVLGAVLP